MAVINPKNYFGLHMSSLQKKMFTAKFAELGPDVEARKHFAEIYTSDTDKNYLISEPALETINNIKVKNPYKILPLFFQSLQDGRATILLNKNHFFRYEKDGDSLICIYMRKIPLESGNFYIDFDAFRLTPAKIFHTQEYQYPDPIHDAIKMFIKVLIFLKCTNVVEIFEMKPKQKARVEHCNDKKWINKSGITVTLVNSDWNKMYYRTEEFEVSGHARFQRHGKGNQLVKLIWIDSYEKKGYSFQRKHK